LPSDNKLNRPDMRGPGLARRYLDTVRRVHEDSREIYKSRLDIELTPLRCSMPLPYIARKARERDRVLDVAYEVRDSRGAHDLRRHVTEMEECIARGDLKAGFAVVRELDRLTLKLRSSLGIDNELRFNMAVSFAGLVQLEAPIRAPSMAWSDLSRTFRIGRPRINFLRDVFGDLARASRLGDVYDILVPPRSRRH
jgi:hypothetical protein